MKRTLLVAVAALTLALSGGVVLANGNHHSGHRHHGGYYGHYYGGYYGPGPGPGYRYYGDYYGPAVTFGVAAPTLFIARPGVYYDCPVVVIGRARYFQCW